MKYKVRIAPFSSITFDFDFLGTYDVVGMFLDAEVRGGDRFTGQYLEILNNVIEDKVINDGMTGNAFDLDVYKDQSKITFMFPADENEQAVCFIDTNELKKIILLWIKEQDKFSTIKKCKEWRSIDSDYTIYCFLASVFHTEIKDFDCALKEYLDSESDASRTNLAKAMEFFLQANYPDADKAAYIKHCADGVAFNLLSHEPLAWLSTILEQIKR